jgi:hypothetical protein
MFGFFKTKTKVTPAAAQVPMESGEVPPALPRGGIQVELIRMVLRETLRFHGIPLEWIKSEVLRVPDKDGKEITQVQLVVCHWNEQLMRYSAVLEKKFQARLAQYESGQHVSRLGVVWRYHSRCNCPLSDMPDENSWNVVKEVSKAQPFIFDDSGYIADTERAYAPTNVAPLTK